MDCPEKGVKNVKIIESSKQSHINTSTMVQCPLHVKKCVKYNICDVLVLGVPPDE